MRTSRLCCVVIDRVIGGTSFTLGFLVDLEFWGCLRLKRDNTAGMRVPYTSYALICDNQARTQKRE